MTTQLMAKNPEYIKTAALSSLQNGQALLNKSLNTMLQYC